MSTGNCIVTVNGVVQNTFDNAILTDINYNLIMQDNEDEYGASDWFCYFFSSNKRLRMCCCIPHWCCCNLCIPDKSFIADDDENQLIHKRGLDMIDDPKNYAKRCLNEKKNKKTRKAVEGMVEQTLKVKQLKQLVPAITVHNYATCRVLINVGQAPFKFAHPQCRTGIVSKQSYQKENSSDDEKGFFGKLFGTDYGDTFGLGFTSRMFSSSHHDHADLKSDDGEEED